MVAAELAFQGPFSLRAAVDFHFGPTEGDPPVWDGAMRLAFPLDGGSGYVGAVLRQDEDGGAVRAQLTLRDGATEPAAIAQISRMLSLDHDGRGFAAVGERDPVLGALQRAHPGQRPVLFASPYEAVAWSVLSARWPLSRGAAVRVGLARDLGRTFSLDGIEIASFPTPDELGGLPAEHPQLGDRKLDRLRGVAAAARAGDLDVERLRELGPLAAHADLQRILGIGPFYATLVVLRAIGFTDAWLGPGQGRVDDAFTRYYGDADPEQVAEGWRPFRTWALVLTRIAAHAGTPR